MPFSQESGLVYSEVVYRVTPNQTNWMHTARGSTRDVEKYRSPGPGCSSLLDMALRKASISIKYMDAATFEGIDWQIAQQLWKKIVAQEVDNLYAWKVFAAAYPNISDPRIQRRCQRITNPNMGLADYISQLISPSFQWLTFLTLSNIICSRADLIAVSKLTNIGALTIGKGVQAPNFGLDDGVVKAWAAAATDAGAFRALRVLACSHQYSITPTVFDHLARLPALNLFLVEACKQISSSEQASWGYQAGKDFGRKLLASKGGSHGLWDSFMQYSFTRSGKYNKPGREPGGVDAPDAKPNIHFFLGVSPFFAAFEHIENMDMQCFYRKTRHSIPSPQLPAASNEIVVASQPSHLTRKKIRNPAKRVPPEHFMTEFGF